MANKIIKKYPWYDHTKATKESGKSLAELFDFKTGTLIWRNDSKAAPSVELSNQPGTGD